MRLLLTCLTVLCLFGLFAQAADKPVTGTWAWTATSDEGNIVKGSLELKEEGGTVTGSLIVEDGGRIELAKVKVEGNALSFEVTVDDDTYAVAVTVDGDKFAGKYKGSNTKGVIEGARKA